MQTSLQFYSAPLSIRRDDTFFHPYFSGTITHPNTLSVTTTTLISDEWLGSSTPLVLSVCLCLFVYQVHFLFFPPLLPSPSFSSPSFPSLSFPLPLTNSHLQPHYSHTYPRHPHNATNQLQLLPYSILVELVHPSQFNPTQTTCPQPHLPSFSPQPRTTPPPPPSAQPTLSPTLHPHTLPQPPTTPACNNPLLPSSTDAGLQSRPSSSLPTPLPHPSTPSSWPSRQPSRKRMNIKATTALTRKQPWRKLLPSRTRKTLTPPSLHLPPCS